MTLSLSWELTNACHLRCATCLPASGPPRPGELPTEGVLGALGRFAEHGATEVLFTGGEPFFRRDFPDVLVGAAGLGYQVGVITSGTLLPPRALAAVERSGARLSVSLDGATPATHDRIRGSGTYARARAGIERLRAAGLRFDLSMTVTAANVAEVRAVAELGHDLGCGRIFYSEISRAGRAEENWEWLALDPHDRAELPTLVAAVSRDVFAESPSDGDDRCWVTGSALHVDATGRAYLCTEIAQRAPHLAIATVGETGGVEQALDRLAEEDHGHRACLYEVHASPRVSLVRVLDRPCAVLELTGETAVALAGPIR